MSQPGCNPLLRPPFPGHGVGFLNAAAAMIAILLAGLDPSPARAHSGGTSQSRWRFDGRVATVEVRLPVAILARRIVGPGGEGGRIDGMALRALRSMAGAYVEDRLTLAQGGRTCPGIGTAIVAAAGGQTGPGQRIIVTRSFRCPADLALRPPVAKIDLLFELATGHLHVARVDALGPRRDPESAVPTVLTFTERRREQPLGPATAKGGAPMAEGTLASIGRFLRLGFEHAASGPDHLLFVLGVALLAVRRRSLLWLVTAFTLGHATSLMIAAAAIARPTAAVIEPLIALSILAVCAEAVSLQGSRRDRRMIFVAALSLFGFVPLWVCVRVGAGAALPFLGLSLFVGGYLGLGALAPRVRVRMSGLAQGAPDAGDDPGRRRRSLVTFLFGLIHGFGFAFALQEVELPRTAWAFALLGFNFGVEALQCGVLLLVTWIGRGLLTGERRPATVQLAAAAIACCALFWLGERL